MSLGISDLGSRTVRTLPKILYRSHNSLRGWASDDVAEQ